MDATFAGKRILVIDDEVSIADTLAAILKVNGYRARACYSGDMAVKTAAEFIPDAIVCDILMPEMDGLVVAKTIRAKFPGCKILLITGQPGATRLVENGGQPWEVLLKPFQASDVLARLQRFVLA
ncbi:MAG TPA: response regulator [Candidatus Angelobacter sp.]|jgi:two-component system OmpR family response regulator|nr:response regulator [Candidatus Angelobacter sp.]